MDKILIDTMWLEAIFSKEEPPYTTLAEAIDNGKIIGVSSVVSYPGIKIFRDNSCECNSEDRRTCRRTASEV